jgi:hypothetical protein
MLFHITHIHNWENCPAHDPEKAKSTFGKMLANADASGVKLLSAFVDPPAHTFYLIIEANDAKQLELFLDPVFKLGSAEIRPVSNALDVLDRRTK